MELRTQTPTLTAYQKLSRKEGAAAYAYLRAQVSEQGLLQRSYGYYALLIAFVFAGFFLSAYNIFTTPLSFLLTVWSLIFSCFTVQLAGLLHDAGHRTIFATTRLNDVVGHVVGALLAMPFSDWRTSHNQHHARPNQEDEDPDIVLPFISLSVEEYRAKQGIAKLLRPYQMYLWYPIASFVSITKRLYGLAYFRRELRKENAWEFALYLAGLFAWFVLPFLLFDPAKAFFVFFATNFISGLYLANVFAPNHKGMPFLPKGAQFSFIEQQIMTARNIEPGPLTDFLYFGLNYQIEHHLFPNCPRNKLKLLTPYVKEICSRLDLPFTQVSVLESNRIILAELKSVVVSAAQD